MAAHALQQPTDTARRAMERHSQRLIIAFVASGLLFMLLPGTFLGVWNLIGISEQHLAGSLSPAWLQAHGQAQIFGWIGSFILGIGFYSLTKMQSTLMFPVRAGWIAWTTWTLGITLRWIGGVTGWHWRVLLPTSGMLQLAAFILFYRSVRRHRPSNTGRRREAWMTIVFGGTIAFLVAMIVNLAAVAYLAISGTTPALPHLLDQQLIVLAVWGVIVPTIWGFNARWLPIFAGFKKPGDTRLLIAYGLSIAGVIAVFLASWAISAVLFFLAALLAIDALHVWEPAVQPAKLLNVHTSFPLFLRIPYIWLVVSCVLSALAVLSDQAGGIWGASRHAITVGFIAGMVFVIGQRVLPAFCGMRILWSTRLMLWSLLLLQLGCAMRVTFEPLAYENYWKFGWKMLPCSAVVELTAVTLFAWNIFATLLQPPAHLRLVTIHTSR
ncbi:NnrS family protein [Alloacidobacterium sp.]|uniref:NnrS family protein n=1 Tax=Alloacidobacterium sp. TaxID=2951999 RepID=UPI002D284437|nr:NnrS family protein [Alloacidobacterium sp.]HYK37519.1 NnrS family protein [Alloacidobacterium sp.]